MSDNEDEPQIMQQPAVAQNITAKAFSAKFRTKRECYHFLTLDCKAYLPHESTVTIYYLKDLISGDKRCKSLLHLLLHYLSLSCSHQVRPGPAPTCPPVRDPDHGFALCRDGQDPRGAHFSASGARGEEASKVVRIVPDFYCTDSFFLSAGS